MNKNQLPSVTKWNEDYWNKNQTKSIQALCAIGIIFHHMAQKTCAPWLPDEYIVHGLEPFLNIGYLLVGVFFFCSGYGLYKSIKSKPDYLKGFIVNHFRPIIAFWLLTNFIFYMTGQALNNYCWFLYAILYLYLAFYISFRICKSESKSIILTAAFTLLYIILCEITVAGSWCYNTIGLFLAGLLFAKYVNEITQFIRKNYWPALIIDFIILAVTFFAAKQLNLRISSAPSKLLYNITRVSAVTLQFISSLSFSILLFTASQKIRLQNKVLAFLGSMTLEIYVIHVYFVELFGYCFVYTDRKEIFYIRNIFLYILAVVSLSILCAWGLLLARKLSHLVYEKFNRFIKALQRDVKKILKGLLIAFAVLTVFLFIYNKVKIQEKTKNADDYKNKYVTFVTSSQQKMSAYVTGEGEQTVLILRGFYDPCPTLTQKALADELAKSFKVVVLDCFGSGFSPEPKTERTSENICNEIHEAADSLGLKKYMLFTEEISSLYAIDYVNRYPQEIETVISMDAVYPNLLRGVLKVQNLNFYEYERQNKALTDLRYIAARISDAVGYKIMLWPFFQQLFGRGLGMEYDDAAYLEFFSHWENDSVKQERLCEIQNYLAVENLKYPENIKVLDMVAEDRRKGFEKQGIKVADELADQCVDRQNHKTVYTVNSIYCVTFNPEVIRKIILENL